MENKMKKIGPWAAAAAAALLVSGLAACSSDDGSGGKNSNGSDCTPTHEVTTITSGKLTVAAIVYPPFSDVKGDTVTGFEGDLVTKIAEKLCLTVQPMQVGIPAIVTSVTTGRADTGIGDFYRTAERDKIVRLGAPVVSDSMALVVRDGVDVKTIADLKGKRVGSAIGYLWDKDLEAYLGKDLTSYSDLQSAYADFEAGRIDVLIDTVPVASYRLKDSSVKAQIIIPPADDRIAASTHPGQTQFMTNLDNKTLGPAMDDLVAEFREDGTLAELIKKWGLPEDIGDPGAPELL